MVENGGQSQPEKRSLEAADSSSCSHGPLRPIGVQLARLITPRILFVVPFSFNWTQKYSTGEQSMLDRQSELIWDQDLVATLVSMVMTIVASYRAWPRQVITISH